MGKSILKIVVFLLFMFNIFVFLNLYSSMIKLYLYNLFPPLNISMNEWVTENRVVGHASGGIDNLSYTNSKESFLNTISNGINVIEIDFQYSLDNQIVCYHTLYDVNCDLVENVSLDEFENIKVQGSYSFMTFEDVLEIMKSNPHIYVAVDTKYDDLVTLVGDIVNKCKDSELLDRLIIQLYYPNQKEKIKEIYDFPNMLFAPYKYSMNPFDTLDVCYTEDINVVVVNYRLWPSEILNLFKSKGIYVYTYTVNRPDIADKLFKSGVYGIYTDFLLDYKSKY